MSKEEFDKLMNTSPLTHPNIIKFDTKEELQKYREKHADYFRHVSYYINLETLRIVQ